MLRGLILLCICAISVVVVNAGLGNRVLLSQAAQSSGAVCLDGTPSAYYFLPGTGTGARKWYIHHEGGGWCSSFGDCYGRSLGALGSSKDYASTLNFGGGYFSDDPKVNPQMYNWNMVYLKYCDGGSFSGDNSTVSNYNGHPLYFRGRRNLIAMRQDLLDNRGLKVSTDVVISGCSAGGLATYLHVDWWKSGLPQAKVVGLPDSGFFLDYESPIKHYHSSMIWTFETMAAQTGVNDACIAAYTKNRQGLWHCFFAQYTSPFIETPMFPLQSEYDSWQVSEDLDSQNVAMINQYGKNLTDLVKLDLLIHPRNGVFLDSCYHHCGEWGSIVIDGANQAKAFEDWYNGGAKKDYLQDKIYPCAVCCHP